MNSYSRDRRRVVAGVAAIAVAPFCRVAMAKDDLLPVTPSATEGPFYPVEYPDDADNDLLRVAGQDVASPGRVAWLRGRILDREGTPIDGARVEIWQCDNGGVYHHPRDRGEKDRRFQGFGAMATDREGGYHFRTLRPVPYTGRTPHIHVKVRADGYRTLTTQLYVAEETERNARDGLYRRYSDAERALVTANFSPLSDAQDAAVAAEFDIVVG